MSPVFLTPPQLHGRAAGACSSRAGAGASSPRSWSRPSRPSRAARAHRDGDHRRPARRAVLRHRRPRRLARPASSTGVSRRLSRRELELTPAERYACREGARQGRRGCRASATSSRSTSTPFQLDGVPVARGGRSVLVAAPTGRGQDDRRGVRRAPGPRRSRAARSSTSTPMKALQQSEVRRARRRARSRAVGLLTGDSNVNSSARVVVMTTEVLRNMLYADQPAAARPPLRRHGRGALPRRPVPRRRVGGGHHPSPRPRCMVALSATVSNAEEFGDWLQAVRGDTDVVVSEERPCRSSSTCSCAASCSTCSRARRSARATGSEAAQVNPELAAADRRLDRRLVKSHRGRRARSKRREAGAGREVAPHRLRRRQREKRLSAGKALTYRRHDAPAHIRTTRLHRCFLQHVVIRPPERKSRCSPSNSKTSSANSLAGSFHRHQWQR